MEDEIETYSVSSVLNRDIKKYGKKGIFNDDDESCWNSEQGSPQWVYIKFKEEKIISSFSIQFQGGFCGKDCKFKGETLDGSFVEMNFYPDDNNSSQTFNLENPVALKSMQFIFDSSSDFFGRIVIYRILWK